MTKSSSSLEPILEASSPAAVPALSRRALLAGAGALGLSVPSAIAIRLAGAAPNVAPPGRFPGTEICKVADAAPAEGPLKKISFAWNAGATCLLGVTVAKEKGFFAKHGLDVELANFAGSTDQLLETLATGKADAAIGMALRWLKPLEQGFDVKIVGSAHGGCLRLLAPAAGGIKDLTALKGKTVAVSDMNSPAKNFFSVRLKKIIEAYLIYWAVVYFVARKWFGFSREWAAPLASGISICGVAAAIATGGAIRARPSVPILVSSLVVVFAVVEILILPFLAQTFLSSEPLVAGAWMGLAIKTDGAAVAGGGITESLILAKAASEGIRYQPGWILGTTATVKVFIDIFIGVWAFILGYIWTNHINPAASGDKARAAEIWQRFPKFILGFIATFAVGLYLALGTSFEPAKVTAAIGEANVFRVIFFILTFFSIGILSNFRKLWEEGIGKLAAVYLLSLFGFVIWVGLAISWIFFNGVKPPLAG